MSAEGASTPAPGLTDATRPASVEELQHSLERLAREDRLHAEALERERVQRELERKKAAQAAARQAESAATPVPAEPERAAPVVAAPAPAKVAPPPVPPGSAAVQPVLSVEQTCANSSNLFTREACKLRACGQASFVNDPVCVRFRQMEAASRRTSEL